MIDVRNALSKTVAVRKTAPDAWTVTQRHSGHYEHHQAATWLQIRNSGPQRQIGIRLRWAEFTCMQFRGFAYLKERGRHKLVTGSLMPTATAYRLDVPPGVSHFGAVPWYSNEDADRFMAGVCREVKGAHVIDIGHTKEGRPIPCLVLGARGGRPRKRHVVLVAREHATETAGSFAIEKVVRHLTRTPQGKRLLQSFVFHVLPTANPDGVAHGRKLPQEAPIEVSDLHYAGMTSSDPTCLAVREYLLASEPAGMVNYHGYLDPVPEVIFYDRSDGMAMLDHLLQRKSDREAPVCYAKWQARDTRTMPGHCATHFGTVVGLFELPWTGRTVRAVETLGLQMFQGVMARLVATTPGAR